MRSSGIVYKTDGSVRSSWSWNGEGNCPFFLDVGNGDLVLLMDNTHPQVPDVIHQDLALRTSHQLVKLFPENLSFLYRLVFTEDPGWKYHLRPKFEVFRTLQQSTGSPPEPVAVIIVRVSP